MRVMEIIKHYRVGNSWLNRKDYLIMQQDKIRKNIIKSKDDQHKKNKYGS